MEPTTIPDPDRETLLALYRQMLTNPPLRRAVCQGFRRGGDPGRLPHLHRRGGGGHRRLRPPAPRRCGVQHAPRPRPCPGQGGHAARADRRALGARLPAVSGGRGGSMHLFKPEIGLHGHQRHRRAEHPAGRGRRPTPSSCSRATASRWLFSAMGRSTTAPSTRGSTWPRPGSCRSSLSARTTSMPTEVPFAKATRNPSVASRAPAYGLPGVEVDGNDVLAVYRAAGEAVRGPASGAGRR